MNPEETPKLLEELSKIIGTPTGIATSNFQESVYPNTDWMELLRTRGINPNLKEAWKDCVLSPLVKSPFSPVRKSRFNILEESVFNHGQQIISKVKNEYERRGVHENGYCNVNLDADVIEDSLILKSKGGKEFNNGLNRINNLGLQSGIFTTFFLNQFAGLSAEAAADSEYVEDRIQLLKEYMNPKLDIKPMNTANADFYKTIDTVESLGGTQFRSSLELGKMFPNPEEFNEAEYCKVKDWILYCKSKNISPNLCLNHFTFPDWMIGGWSEPVNSVL